MTHTPFQHPVLGIFTQLGNSQLPGHAYAAIFERAEDGRITDYRVINFSGTPEPPAPTHLTHDPILVDSGVLLPITRDAATRLLDEVNSVADELQADPKIQRFYHVDALSAPSSTQESKGRTPTNCIHFVLNATHRAGVDIAALDPNLLRMDQVDSLVEMVDARLKAQPSKRMIVTSRFRTAFDHGITHLNGTNPVVFFKGTQDANLLDVINTLPPAYMEELSSTPETVTMPTTPTALTTNHVPHTAVQGIELGG